MDLTSKEVCEKRKKGYVTPELKVVKIEQNAMLLQSSDDLTIPVEEGENK